MGVGEAFDQSVETYDEWMKTAIPNYDLVFSTAVSLIPFDRIQGIRVLDLGAGTGLFSQHVLSAYPRAGFVLVDLAPKMLSVARYRFKNYENDIHYREENILEIGESKIFDLVISSLSIHHLDNEQKQELFQKIFRALKVGGVFINVDQIRGPSPALEKLYWNVWLGKVKSKNPPEDQIKASIQRRLEYDRDSLLVDQLAWLTRAGFKDVDCVFKDFFIGVFYAVKKSLE